jgi:type VI secretion system protein ImpF
MAELIQKERLQPSLLDRLTDDEPAHRAEARDKRLLSPAQLRESVRRDLTWLFNTTRLAASLPSLEDHPFAASSVINFGIPDLAGRTASAVDIPAMESALRQAILDFEPRLLPASVTVRGLLDARDTSHNAVSFAIDAELWAQPMPLRLALRTQIDLEGGYVQISDLDERKGG